MANEFDNHEQLTHLLSLLTPSETVQLLEQGTNTQTDYPRDSAIHELFQLQAAKTPHKIAIAYKDTEITYDELDKKSSILAYHLQKNGVKKETLVGLYVNRSPDLIIAILAILKAGGAYLPLDTSGPLERIKIILEDSKIPILITQNHYINSIQRIDQELKTVIVDNVQTLDKLTDKSVDNYDVEGDNLAYVMYTSGSTGKPKGVCINHRGVIRLVKNNNYGSFNENDVFLQLASIAFDAATFEIWQPLLNGGKLVLIPEKKPSLQNIGEAIKRYNITSLWLTSGLFNLIVEEHIEYLKPLRNLLAGGDVLSVSHVKRVLEELPNCQLINGYGPTENTTFTCCHKITIDDTKKESIPIGRPISNTVVYVLNEDLQLVPIGTPGELYIGGDGLANGYLHNSHLTQEKFIKNPFTHDPNSRLYRTGDRVRWNQQGNLEFLGRIDFQVKIRGYRVELGEIEKVLSECPSVHSTVVLATEDSFKNKIVIAYIIPKQETSQQDLKEFLRKKIPDYMIPSEFIFIQQFPLNVNGKVDRKYLLNLRLENKQDDNLILPDNPLQQELASIWQEILGKKISIDKPLIELGGNSLQAIQIVSRLRDRMKVDLPVSILLEGCNIIELATDIKQYSFQENFINWSDLSFKNTADIQELPLSLYQERMWLINQEANSNAVYNLPIIFRLKGLLNVPVLEKAINQLIKRHESLRTYFPLINGLPVQRILSNFSIEIPIKLIDKNASKIVIDEKIEKEINIPFQVTENPPIRCLLLKLDERETIFITVIHHLIADGWSLEIFLRELSLIYDSLLHNKILSLSPVSLQYKDFTRKHLKWLGNPKIDNDLVNYWTKKLEDAPFLSTFLTDYPRPPLETFDGGIETFELTPELTRKLKELSQTKQATLYHICLSAFLIFLYRFTNQRDLVTGVTLANRNYLEIESTIGLFSNIIPFRVTIDDDHSFLNFLNVVKQLCLDIYDYQDFPVEQMLKNLGKNRDLSYRPWFQVVFNFLNISEIKLDLEGLKSEKINQEKKASLCDLTVLLWEKKESLQGLFEYNVNLFKRETVSHFIEHFKYLLDQIVLNPQDSIFKINLINEKEKKLILNEWNNTQSPYPKEICIHHLFEQQVKQTPEAIALVFEGKEISYQTLNYKANQLAYNLQNVGVSSETVVGIYLESSIEIIIVLVAILKVGGTYLPLDPSYPKERINYMLEDGKISFLVSWRSLINNLPNYQGEIIFVDEKLENNFEDYQENPHINITSNNLAYIIYTSGSTGKPKGVQIEQKSLINLLFYFKNKLNITSQDSWLSVTTLSFDIAALEIFLPLITGAKLILVSREVACDGIALLKTLNQSQATVLQATPSTWQMLLLAGWKRTPNLTMLSGGEALSQELAKELLARGYRLYNVYGPTETTIWSLCNCISNNEEKISIGYPINNTEIYILDIHLQPVPIGVPGELYIAGEGLARGYLNRPELTRERFIQSPFNPEQKLYKTGDLACYQKDGKINFLGRLDQQVKIRGFRIELGEIEDTLNKHNYVEKAIVITKKDTRNQAQLVAYFVPHSSLKSQDNKNYTLLSLSQQKVSEIRQYLQQKLPSYMVPCAFVALRSFPLTPNRKIDYRAFPEPNFLTSKKDYVPPRTPIEEILTIIWSEVLDINNIGIYDNFFELGGHSLLGTQIISRIRDKFNEEISLQLLFQHPTIEKLSQHISISRNQNNSLILPDLEPLKRPQYLPLSFAQESLWFLTQLEPNSTAYNMPFILELKGSLNIVALEKSLNQIIKRHEILRTNFISIDGQPTQIIHQNSDFKLSIYDLKNLENNQKETEAKKNIRQLTECPFNLAKDSLFSVKLLQLDSELSWLIFNIHHIIFDRWSYEILEKELFTLYQVYCQEKSSTLSPVPIQYADFSLWQRRWYTDKNLEVQLNYWKEQLKGILPVLQLPTDFPRPPVQTHKGASYSWYLSSELTTTIKSFCQQEKVTLFMTFLTVFKLLLSRYTAEKDIIVGTPIASRNRTEIENLIGFFINTVALRTHLGNNPSFRQLLSRVQQMTLDAYVNQDLPFERLVEELKPDRNLSYHPIFQVWFNMINLPKNTTKCDNLQVRLLPIFETIAKFDLSFYVEEEDNKIKLEFVYNKLLFESNTIERMAMYFQKLLEQVIITPEQNISRFFLLSEKERYQLNHQGNIVRPTNSFLNFPKIAIEQSIPSRFEEQVKKYPNKIAVQSKDNQYTYQQLNHQANKIAQYLRNITANKQIKVALIFDHNVAMIAAIIGVLKAGQIYVPLDPNYPQARVLYILENSDAEVILTNDKNLDHVQVITKERLPIINIDKLDDVDVKINLDISPDTLAYILYTSGSTGKPKGVIQNHRNVLHFIRNHTNNLHISADDNLNLLASYSFDAAIVDTFSALLNGATLFIFDIKEEGLNNLSNWLQAHKITIYHSTPTVYRYFIEILESKQSLAKDQLSNLRLVILGGEPVVKKDVQLYQTFFADHCILVNGLGSTECSFYLQYLINKTTKINQKSVSVGYAFEETEIVLLDEEGNITDICGEIAVKSPHIALGYWQQEDLTQAVFLNNFQGDNKRIYRTGDWGRLRNNGVIDCLGRKDFQIKVRGFRIELQEIETVLNEYDQVQQTVVIHRENNSGDKQLIAYIVPQDISVISNSQYLILQQLRAFLEQKLPTYMIPAQFVLLQTFPLTPNGKIDRRILAARDDSKQLIRETFILPRNPLELQISNIWQKMLGIELIGVNDNFFDLGGHSLLAIRLLARIEKEFNVNIPLYFFFNKPNISSLVNLIQRSEDTIPESSVVPIQTKGYKLPLFFVNSISYAQKLASYLDEDQPFYILNIFGITEFLAPKIDCLKLEDIATKLIEDMETVAPNGPYYLITYCGDLSLTIEIVKQLEKKEVATPLVFLIDSFWKPEDLGFYLHWYNLRQFGINYLVEKIKNNFSTRREKATIFINRLVGQLRFLNPNDSSRYIKNIKLLKALEFARSQYSAQGSQVKVILFLSQEYRLLKTSKLDEFFTEKIDIQEIPGYHHTLFQEPYIQELTQKLQNYLK